MEECGPCPVFASFTLAFALQLREKHGKTSVRVRKTSVRFDIYCCCIRSFELLMMDGKTVRNM
jgi:hypothetical protein